MKKSTAILLLLLLTRFAVARAPEESEFEAAAVIGEEIAEWVVNREPRPRSIGIYYVHSNYPLDQDYSTVVENEIQKELAARDLHQISTCAECRSPIVNVTDDRVVVSRGAPDVETIKRMGQKYPVDTFLMVEIYRTKLSVSAQVSFYANPTGDLIGAERFKVPALNVGEAAAQFLVTLGMGKALSGKGVGEEGYIQSANLLLLEAVGFGKAGLNIGAILGGGSLIYVNPTLGFTGRFGMSEIGYGLHLGLGYGMGGGAKGFAFRGAYQIFMGSTGSLGFEAAYFLPDRSGADVIQGFAGVNVGISLGR